MARHQDRTWFVLPEARRAIWKINEHRIDVIVVAFAFDGDQPIWLTINSTVIQGIELAGCA